METFQSTPYKLPSSSSSSSKVINSQNPNSSTDSPKPPPSSVTRLWRPAAQRNLRNQWSKLASCRQQWMATSSTGKSHATSLVNAYLSQRYMNAMELGALSDMPNIRIKASWKLCKQQELHQRQLLSSYKDLVATVIQMVNTSRSMRCYLKGPSSSPLVQFSSSLEEKDDYGDGGGIPVFVFWTIAYFETLAEELVEMFALELSIKRRLVVELLSISCEKVPPGNGFRWSDELYPGEFDDLSICHLYSEETCEPVLPSIRGGKAKSLAVKSNHQPDQDILQFYLTTWLVEVNINTYRVEEIFAASGEEMHVSLS